ncbi:MAG: diglucosylglycerate octanoyltransferase [Actinomycetota bacterium]|jgi:hypothetical protein|nr:diglucosylglycerate octanoyltransferase [Actinomycetota bacterium]
MNARERRLVVLGDSLVHWTHEGRLPLDEPAIYPNRLAGLLEERLGGPWKVDIIAKEGTSLRELSLALPLDRFVQERVLADADIVLIQPGTRDSWTVGLPMPLTFGLALASMGNLPLPVRKSAFLQRLLVRLTGSRLRFTPSKKYVPAYRRIVELVRRLSPQAVVCVHLPSLPFGPQPFFVFSAKHHADTVAETRALAEELDLVVIDVPRLIEVEPPPTTGDLIHWPLWLHDAMARAAVELIAQRWTHVVGAVQG